MRVKVPDGFRTPAEETQRAAYLKRRNLLLLRLLYGTISDAEFAEWVQAINRPSPAVVQEQWWNHLRMIATQRGLEQAARDAARGVAAPLWPSF